MNVAWKGIVRELLIEYFFKFIFLFVALLSDISLDHF